MAVSIAAGAQRFNFSPQMLGSATAYSETVTATGALDVKVPVSIVNVNGTASSVVSAYTLGTAPYEGYRKIVLTGQGAATASDSLGIVLVELSNTVGSTASTANVIQMRHPGMVECVWINDRWAAMAGLQAQFHGPLMGTATVDMLTESISSSASGAISPTIPITIISVAGTATTVVETMTLAAAPYDGFEKIIVTKPGAASATLSLGQIAIEIGALTTATEYDQMIIRGEMGDAWKMVYANSRWVPFAALSLATAVSSPISTATA